MVPDAADEGAGVEGEEGGKGLLIRLVEVARLARLPQARDGDRELDEVASLEAAPDEDGGEGYGVTEEGRLGVGMHDRRLGVSVASQSQCEKGRAGNALHRKSSEGELRGIRG